MVLKEGLWNRKGKSTNEVKGLTGQNIFEELKAVWYGWNEGYVWKKKTKTTRLEIQRGARSPRAFCVILGGLTLKKWSRIGFHVARQEVPIKTSKFTPIQFMAPDQVLNFLVSRPKFLKGRYSFGWTEQVLYVEFHSVTKSWVSRSYQRWYLHSTWSSRRNTLFAKSWSKQMEWGADATIKSRVPWTLTIARESWGLGGERGHLTVKKGAA